MCSSLGRHWAGQLLFVSIDPLSHQLCVLEGLSKWTTSMIIKEASHWEVQSMGSIASRSDSGKKLRSGYLFTWSFLMGHNVIIRVIFNIIGYKWTPAILWRCSFAHSGGGKMVREAPDPSLLQPTLLCAILYLEQKILHLKQQQWKSMENHWSNGGIRQLFPAVDLSDANNDANISFWVLA